MKRVTGIGGIFFKAKDPVALRDWYTESSVGSLIRRATRSSSGSLPRGNDYGGRGFTCRDLRGHIWNVGTYDPWVMYRQRSDA